MPARAPVRSEFYTFLGSTRSVGLAFEHFYSESSAREDSILLKRTGGNEDQESSVWAALCQQLRRTPGEMKRRLSELRDADELCLRNVNVQDLQSGDGSSSDSSTYLHTTDSDSGDSDNRSDNDTESNALQIRQGAWTENE
eukprot:gene31866-39366_t